MLAVTENVCGFSPDAGTCCAAAGAVGRVLVRNEGGERYMQIDLKGDRTLMATQGGWCCDVVLGIGSRLFAHINSLKSGAYT